MWWWVLIWALLVLLAAIYLGSRAWGVWGQVKELNAEIGRASETVAALETHVDRLGERAPAPTPDLFGDPRHYVSQPADCRRPAGRLAGPDLPERGSRHARSDLHGHRQRPAVKTGSEARVVVKRASRRLTRRRSRA